MTPTRNEHVHPAFRAVLNSMCEPAPLRPFVVQIKAGARVLREFDAMGTGKVAVQLQHEGLCEPGEQCVVLTPEEARGRRDALAHAEAAARRNEERALRLQQSHPWFNRGPLL